MSDRKIIYVNQKQLASNLILTNYLKENFPYHNWAEFLKIHQIVDTGIHSSYIRAGINTLPFDSSGLIESPSMTPMPKYDPDFKLNFTEITDAHALNLHKAKFDNPWLVSWSGGIDSTTVICAILKNIPKSDLENITIVCNATSVYESPLFYHNHVLPNFKVINSTHHVYNKQNLSDYYHVDGEMADILVGVGILQKLLVMGSDALFKSFDEDSSILVNFLDELVDPNFTDWYLDKIFQNAASCGIPITNAYDFSWWLNFNSMWAGNKFRGPASMKSITPDVMQLYFHKCINWYDNTDYQSWSLTSNQRGFKTGNNIGQHKLPYKKYIYEYTKDEYFLHFKTKDHSMSRTSRLSDMGNTKLFCVLDDYSVLSIEKDLDQILELLPKHVMPDNNSVTYPLF